MSSDLFKVTRSKSIKKSYGKGQHTPFFEWIIVVNSLRIIAFTRTINIDEMIIQNNAFQSLSVMCECSYSVMITRNSQNK